MTIDEFRKLFEMAPERYPRTLEEGYPRVLSKILSNWDNPHEQERNFQDLVVDLRGNRQGFPPKVMEEILFLSEIYTRWRSDRRRKADDARLKSLSAKMIPDIEKEMPKLTPEVLQNLSEMKALMAKDDPKILDFCQAKGINPNQKDADGQTPLMHAAMMNAEKTVLTLIKMNANPHMMDVTGNTALHWAVVSNRMRISEILLYFGANPDAKNKGGATPLSLASIKTDTSIMKRLLDYGADVLSFDNNGNFPLHKAVSAKAKEAAWLLIQAGSSMSARNKDGLSAQDLADKDPEMKLVFEKFKREMAQKEMSRKS